MLSTFAPFSCCFLLFSLEGTGLSTVEIKWKESRQAWLELTYDPIFHAGLLAAESAVAMMQVEWRVAGSVVTTCSDLHSLLSYTACEEPVRFS